MNELTGEKQERSGQIPYTPVPLSRTNRFRRTLRRYAFAAACALFFGLFCTSFWLLPYYHASDGAPALDRSRLQDAPPDPAYAEAGMLPADSPAASGTTALSATTRPAKATTSINRTPAGITSPSTEANTAARPSRPDTPERSSTPERAAPASPHGTPARGTLQFVTHPAGASVRINGRSVGKTPVRIVGIPAGAHTITLQARGHQSLTRKVTVRPAGTQTIEERLPPLTGTLSIRIKPWGAIYIDGALRKSAPDVRFRTVLPVGPHRLTIEHPDLGTWEKTIQVAAGESASVTVDFSNIAPRGLASRANGTLSGW